MYLIYKLWYTTIKNSKWYFFFGFSTWRFEKKKKKKILGNLKGHSMGVEVSILEPKGVITFRLFSSFFFGTMNQ